MPLYLSPVCNDQMLDVNGDPLSGGMVETYIAGSSTPTATYTSSAGTVQQANPIVINSLGYAPSPIWLAAGVAYKFVIKDALGATLRTIDDVRGVNDASVSQSEWVNSGLVATYIGATSFSVPGDQTSVLHVGRRLRTTNTAGTIYSTISTSVYSAGVTTVTVANDSGTLDAGLADVAYGLLSYLPSSHKAATAYRSDSAASADNAGLLDGIDSTGYTKSTGTSELGTSARTTSSTAGGLSGGVQLRNSGGGAGAGTFLDAVLHGVSVGSIIFKDTGDGGCEISFARTPPGDPGTDRRVFDSMKLRNDGIVEAAGFLPTAGAGTLGTWALLRRNASTNPSDTVAGSELFYAGLQRAGDGVATVQSSSSPPGTWRCYAYAPSSGSLGAVGLYVRIS